MHLWKKHILSQEAHSGTKDLVSRRAWNLARAKAAGGGKSAAIQLKAGGSLRKTVSEEEAVLKTLEHTYARIAPSRKYGGVGVFAVRNIPPGIDPFRGITDPPVVKLSHSNMKRLHPGVQKMVKDFFLPNGKQYTFETEPVFSPQDQFPIPATGLNGMDVSFFVNHNAETPNLGVNTSNPSNMTTFVTERSIAIGEELTYNYNTG